MKYKFFFSFLFLISFKTFAAQKAPKKLAVQIAQKFKEITYYDHPFDQCNCYDPQNKHMNFDPELTIKQIKAEIANRQKCNAEDLRISEATLFTLGTFNEQYYFFNDTVKLKDLKKYMICAINIKNKCPFK